MLTVDEQLQLRNHFLRTFAEAHTPFEKESYCAWSS